MWYRVIKLNKKQHMALNSTTNCFEMVMVMDMRVWKGSYKPNTPLPKYTQMDWILLDPQELISFTKQQTEVKQPMKLQGMHVGENDGMK